MAFDYGAKLATNSLENMRVYPPTGKKTYLLDADYIPYNVGFNSDIQEYLKFKNSEEPFNSQVWIDKQVHALQMLNKAVHLSGCDSVLVYLTEGKNNFRNEVAYTEPYKGKRDGDDKPPFFEEIKEWLHNYYKANM